MAKKYIKILVGEYKGRYGIVRQYTPRQLLVVDFHRPIRGWEGTVLLPEDVEYITEQEYFKGILRAC